MALYPNQFPTTPALNFLDFGPGIDSTGTYDNTAALQGAINTANGRALYIPAGIYNFTGAITTTVPINLIGDGCGMGPGVVTTANTTVINVNSTTGDFLTITGLYGGSIQGIQFNSTVTRTSGSAVSFLGPGGGGNQTNFKLYNCGFVNQYDCFTQSQPTYPLIYGNVFLNWTRYAIYSYTLAAREGLGGNIFGNFFYGQNGVSTQIAIFMHCGYTAIKDNWFIGGNTAIYLSALTRAIGQIEISGNSIENQDAYAILMLSADGTTVSMVSIHDNEFSSGVSVANYIACIDIEDYNSGTAWISNVKIHDNVYTMPFGTNALTSRHIWIKSGTNIMIRDELMDTRAGTGANTVGIDLSSLVGAALVAPIIIDVPSENMIGTYATGKILWTNKTLNRNGGQTVANLPAVGSYTWGRTFVTDCSNSTSFGAVVAGGAGGFTPVYSDGTSWRTG